jgi:hypothetical protein
MVGFRNLHSTSRHRAPRSGPLLSDRIRTEWPKSSGHAITVYSACTIRQNPHRQTGSWNSRPSTSIHLVNIEPIGQTGGNTTIGNRDWDRGDLQANVNVAKISLDSNRYHNFASAGHHHRRTGRAPGQHQGRVHLHPARNVRMIWPKVLLPCTLPGSNGFSFFGVSTDRMNVGVGKGRSPEPGKPCRFPRPFLARRAETKASACQTHLTARTRNPAEYIWRFHHGIGK